LAEAHGLLLTDKMSFNEMGIDFKVGFAKDHDGQQWLLRIPRRNDLGDQIEKEKRILNLVKRHLLELVIGTETLSRISDPHDRDSMIYADGAGAVVLEARQSNTPVGVLSHATKSYADELAYVLRMGKSSNPEYRHDHLFLKMNGRKLYEYALKAVPQTMKECIDQAGLSVSEVNKVLIHQANEKMDEAILRNLFELYGLNSSPKDMMPMTISWLGNSSVATLPTLYDLMHKGKLID